MPGARHCVKGADICEDLGGGGGGVLGGCSEKGWEESLSWRGGGERQPQPAREGRGPVHPLAVALGSAACQSAGSPLLTPLPPAPAPSFCTFFPVIPSFPGAHDLFLGFTAAKAELRLPSLGETFPIKAPPL